MSDIEAQKTKETKIFFEGLFSPIKSLWLWQKSKKILYSEYLTASEIEPCHKQTTANNYSIDAWNSLKQEDQLYDLLMLDSEQQK